MLDLAIIFVYTQKDNITLKNLDSIKNCNPNIPVFEISQHNFTNYHYDFLDPTHISLWQPFPTWYWGCDNIFIYWYLSNNIRAKNYIIVEWDTYCHQISFEDFFGSQNIKNNKGITASTVISLKTHPNDVWFKDKNIELLKRYFSTDEITKYSPMSCSIISDECVSSIIEFIKDNPLSNKLYIETKFSSIAKHLGFTVKQHDPNISDNISYHEKICERKLKELYKKNFVGIFHPIKKLSSLSFFANNDDIIVHKCIYGSMVDITNISKSIISDGGKILANNDLGGDPAPYKTKQLYIQYEKNGQIYEQIVNEGDIVNFDLV